MKTWFAVVLVGLMFTSCDEDLEFNYPALQAKRNGELWTTITQEVSNSSTLIITATGNEATITMELPELKTGTYLVGVVGEDENATATGTFTDETGVTYSTLYNAVDNISTPNIDESVVYYSEGAIEVTDINTTEGYVSGVFWFTAYTNSGENKVDFNEGVFYEVPFVTE
jgi:hypothetical protein